jgi:diguanylate cyclase (GGDEF)-like protein
MRDHVRPLSLLFAAAAVFALDRAGAFLWAERLAVEARMAAAARNASGRIIFVAIDHRSIRDMEAWPWPREAHATLLRQLIELGATEVFLDIDLSAPSNPASDTNLADALAEAGGKVILPVFKQAEGIGRHSEAVSENLPLKLFRDHTWIASVNVTPGPDGRVWRYPWGQVIDGGQVGSAGAVIAGRLRPPDADFGVNYAIMPSSVPTISAIDVLKGRLDRHSIEGRSVVVGAYAAELGDYVAVPVHGVVAGPLLHILAAETLMANAALIPLERTPPFLAVAALAFALALSPLGRRPILLAGALGAIGAAIEILAFVLQTRIAVVLPTPLLHASLVVVATTIAVRELDLRRWLVQGFRIEARNSRNVLKQVVTDSSDAILIVEETGAVLEMNGRAHELFGPAQNARQPLEFDAFLPPDLSEVTRNAMTSLRIGHTIPKKIVRMLWIEESGLHLECSVTPSRLERRGQGIEFQEHDIVACITVRDVTITHEQQKRLDYLARFDALTGSLNRTEFLQRLNDALFIADHAVFAVNLHRFKTINATMGRTIGDRVLCALVERLMQAAPSTVGIGRLGGDVFAAARPGLNRADAEATADALIAAVAVPFEVDGVKVYVSARVGIAFARASGDAGTVVDQAELALDAARESAGPTVRHFDDSTSSAQERSRRIERALWTAISNCEFYIAYQPQVELRGSCVIGVEALTRWQHPTMGNIPPCEFIPVAESSGFIKTLGRWVLEQACTDAARWPISVPVAVNVSPLQFQCGDVVADVRRALSASQLPPNRLCLEITESNFVAKSDSVMRSLLELRELGVRLVLDDFGAGFSSFGYLTTLPIDKLKLDRMFAHGLEDGAATGAIVATVVTLCRELGLELLCEGVETSEQKDRLGALGCQQAQGYLFSRPLVHSDLLNWFQSQEVDGKAA